MIQWPSLASGSGGEVPQPVELSLAEAGQPVAPPVALAPVAEASDPVEIVSAGRLADWPSLAAPVSRRRSLAAVLMSLLVHTAAVAAVALLITQDGFDASTDAISVEIVLEPAPIPAEQASSAGGADETVEAAAPDPGAADTPALPPTVEPEAAQVTDPLEQAEAAELDAAEFVETRPDVAEEVVAEHEVAELDPPPAPDPLEPAAALPAIEEPTSANTASSEVSSPELLETVEPAPAPQSAEPRSSLALAEALPPLAPLPPRAELPDSRSELAAPISQDPVAPEVEDAPAPATTVPVPAAPPSLQAMLPALAVPPPPRFDAPEPAPATVAPLGEPMTFRPEPRPVRSEQPPREEPATRRASPAKPREPNASQAKAEAQSARTTDTERAELRAARETTRKARGDKAKADKARADKANADRARAVSPRQDQARPGAARTGKAKAATQAGSTASARASAGDRDSFGRKVNGHVQRYKRYPAAAARDGVKGAVKVSISIGGSGNLASARVTGSSGFAVLDSEALATVRRAAPYPKPPASFGGTARFSLTLRYSK